MPYTCHNHSERQGWPQLEVQDGWTEDGRRVIKTHHTEWQAIQCGHNRSDEDPGCAGCIWRKIDEN